MGVLHDGNLPVISLKGSPVHQLYNLYILTKLSPSVCECEFLCATDSSLGDEILSGDSPDIYFLSDMTLNNFDMPDIIDW